MSKAWMRVMPGAAVLLAVAGGVGPVAAQNTLMERLQVHGYLTQGYATSSELPIFGIPTDGTPEYRAAGLQFRYAVSDRDFAVLQLRHRRLGNSALTQAEPEVALDWAFYQRRFGAGSMKIGRIPLPSGLFNETRAVGTLVPFYRAPANYYLDGIETMDGASASYSLDLGRWSIEGTGAAGQVDMRFSQTTPAGPEALSIELKRFVAGEVWVMTPLTGVRVGVSAQSWDKDSTPPMEGATAAIETPLLMSASAEAVRDRYFVRAEYRHVDMGAQVMTMYYTHGGVHFGRFGVSGQADAMDLQVTTPFGDMGWDQARDYAVGFSFAHAPNLVYKFEAHRATGVNFDVFMDPMSQSGRSNYFIGSVSVSF